MRLAPGGVTYTGILLVLAVPTLLVVPVVGALFVLLAAGTVLFYRDPVRSPPTSGIVAPADGRVSVLRTEDDRIRLGVFMNVWNVHVNRSPFPGSIAEVTHEPGAHRPAFSKESDRNERVRMRCETPHGTGTVTLIAGAFARRIHPYVGTDTAVERGERIGHISFGSRADVLMPACVDRADIAVDRGEHVRAGETVLVSETALVADECDEADRIARS
jgi:phosphatidylserine decarboxylase